MIRSILSTGRRVPHTLAASVAALVLIVMSAMPAAAQDPAPLAKLDPTSKYNVDVILDSAVAAGLPSRSILARALEGVAKHADNRRIVDACRKRLVSLRAAHASLGGVSPEELEAAASLIEAGAKTDQLEKFRARQPGRSDLEAFTYWADFLARGVPKDEAFSAINKLWQDGADDATFHSLWNNVQSDILQGLNPGTALQNRIRETPGRAPAPVKPPEGP